MSAWPPYLNVSGELIVKIVNTAATPPGTEIHVDSAPVIGAGQVVAISASSRR